MPQTRAGANTIPDKSTPLQTDINTNMATDPETTLKAILDMVRNTNSTVTMMETRLKRLEEESNPEINCISTQLTELTTSVNAYTDQISKLETTVTTQQQVNTDLTAKVQDLECQNRIHNLIVEGIPERRM